MVGLHHCGAVIKHAAHPTTCFQPAQCIQYPGIMCPQCRFWYTFQFGICQFCQYLPLNNSTVRQHRPTAATLDCNVPAAWQRRLQIATSTQCNWQRCVEHFTDGVVIVG